LRDETEARVIGPERRLASSTRQKIAELERDCAGPKLFRHGAYDYVGAIRDWITR
jgi:hypothetical protein